MSFVQSFAVIQVDLSVSRYRQFPEDKMVEIWGHVGDYEVCIYLPLEQARTRGLLGEKVSTATKRQETQDHL